MNWISLWFIRTSVVYLFIATVIGVIMAVSQDTIIDLRFIHVHLNLLGWMSMMIYGVGYHIFPRFSGRPLWSERIAVLQFWTAQIGLLGMCLFYFLDINSLFVIFSFVNVLSVFLFVFNILKTVRGLS